jgi:hypothetical protein
MRVALLIFGAFVLALCADGILAMRVALLIFGAFVLALCGAEVLRHVVMVPMTDPFPWIMGVATGITMVGYAVMREPR